MMVSGGLLLMVVIMSGAWGMGQYSYIPSYAPFFCSCRSQIIVTRLPITGGQDPKGGSGGEATKVRQPDAVSMKTFGCVTVGRDE